MSNPWSRNICMLTDSYKVTHAQQYPPGTSNIYSYFESRGGKFKEVVFFGLNYFLNEYLSRRVTQEDVDYAASRWGKHFGNSNLFNRQGWEYIVHQHGGKLPVSIKAVPEGTVVPVSNILMSVENTDPNVPWLTNWLETLLSEVWYPCTVATQSREMKKVILNFLKKTGDPSGINFKLHDFGFRGVSSPETAGIGGAAHLVNFMGTDTALGFEFVEHYYNEDMAGFSIPAAEHSTITSWGKDNEVSAFKNMMDRFGNGAPGMYAVVSDSYDIMNACAKLWGEQLKKDVLRFPNTLVVRPDSGNPVEVLPKVLDILGEKFGYELNTKGYKVLNPKVRVIQGDGIDYEEIGKILSVLSEHKWSADNIAFGSGGGLLQKVNRDTQKFAFKCSSARIYDQDREVFKQPVTDPGKVSKKGKLKLVNFNNQFKTVPHNDGLNDCLVEVFRDGRILEQPKFLDIRNRASLE